MKTSAQVYLFSAVMFWSINPVSMKVALNDLDTIQIAAIRLLLATSIIYAIVKLRREQFRFKDNGWLPYLAGALEPGLNAILFVWALNYISAANAVLVVAMQPFTQALLGRLILKEHLSVSVFFGSLVALSGVALFLSSESLDLNGRLNGNLILLHVFIITSVCQLMVRKFMRDGMAVLQFTLTQMTVSSIIILAVLAVSGRWQFANGIPSTESLLTTLYLGASLGLPFLLYNLALRHLSVSYVSLSSVLVVPIGFFWAALLLEESMPPVKIAGAMLVICGVVLPQLFELRLKPAGV